MLTVWNGGRDVDQYAAPDADDWQNIVAELQGTQRAVNNRIYENEIDEDIVIGQPLVLESGILKLASQNNPEVIGISLGKTNYMTQGQLILDDWSQVTNSFTLTPGDCYYLADQGKLTNIPPNHTALVVVGRAQTSNTLDVDIELPIYL